jgi:hypothetical protein
MVDIDEYLPAHPDASSISPETWRRFENATLAVVHRIQPTASSEYLRAAVIDLPSAPRQVPHRVSGYHPRSTILVPYSSIA